MTTNLNTDKLPSKPRPLQTNILDILAEKPLSSKQIFEKLNSTVKLRTVRYNLKKMVTDGRLKFGYQLQNMRNPVYAINREGNV